MRARPAPPPSPLRPRSRPWFSAPGPKVGLILADYKAGKSAQAVSNERGISRNAILKLLRDSGVPVPSRRLPDDQRAALVRSHETGESVLGLVEQHHLSNSGVWQVLKDAGVQLRSRGMPKQ